MDPMTMILTFGAGFFLCAIVDRLYYRKRIGDAYEMGTIDGATAVVHAALKNNPKALDGLEGKALEFNKGKVL